MSLSVSINQCQVLISKIQLAVSSIKFNELNYAMEIILDLAGGRDRKIEECEWNLVCYLRLVQEIIFWSTWTKCPDKLILTGH